jgi:tripartite motif-containing protein 71
MRRMRLAVAVLALVSLAGAARADVSFEFENAFGGFGIGRERFDQVADVAVDRDENVYVLDRGNNRIQALDRRGRFLREWGGRGFSPGSFDAPSAIVIDRNAGFLLVVDTGNHRIQKFDLNGKLLLNFGRLGSGDGEFNKPSDVALDKRGNIFVSDTGNNRVQKFDPSGKFLADWGKFSRRRRGLEIDNPVSVAYTDEGLGAIYVLNAIGCRVLKFDTDGSLLKEWTMHKKGEGLLCGPSRIRIELRRYTVYIADAENNRIVLFDKDGEPLGELKGGKTAFKKPTSLCINDAYGEQLVVADTGNNLVQTFRRGR